MCGKMWKLFLHFKPSFQIISLIEVKFGLKNVHKVFQENKKIEENAQLRYPKAHLCSQKSK